VPEAPACAMASEAHCDGPWLRVATSLVPGVPACALAYVVPACALASADALDDDGPWLRVATSLVPAVAACALAYVDDDRPRSSLASEEPLEPLAEVPAQL